MYKYKDRMRLLTRCLLVAFALCIGLNGVMMVRAVHAQAVTGDPTGASTGNSSDVTDGAGNPFVPSAPPTDTTDPTYGAKFTAYNDYQKAARAEPLAALLADDVGQNRIAINVVWTLITGYLVMFMQCGFSLVEIGFTRAKNAAHVFMTTLMIYPLGMLGFYICGFAFMFGSMGSLGGVPNLGGVAPVNNPDWHEIIGTQGFFLAGKFYDVGVFTLFLFQMVFMDTMATIPTGAMAERWKFSAFMVYGLYAGMIDYPIYGHWVWGGGWLALLGEHYGFGHGAVDFAGSGVVHAIGGWTALAGCIVLGPRIGKFIDGKPQPMPGHNIPMALLGTFVLAFGWFGFNPGSTLGASGAENLRIAIIATNTMLASATGAVAACLYWWWRYGHPDPGMSANGMLAGLVAITAPCAFVNSQGACALGAIAGVLVCISVVVVENCGVDDPVGAVSVHGSCGIWGLLSVGIFADGKYGAGWNNVGSDTYMGHPGQGVTGCIYGDWSQLLAQGIDACVNICWAFGVSFIFFSIQKAVMGIRSKPQDEIDGLDLPEMGAYAYPDMFIETPEPELPTIA